MLISDLRVHRFVWTPNMGPSINPVNADSILPNADPDNDALDVTIASSQKYGGGLVSCNRPVPLVNGLPLAYLGVDWFIKPSRAAVRFNRCYETDAIVVFPPAPNSTTAIQNHYDGSIQRNMAEGGMYQIDDPKPSWIDSAFNPGNFTPEVFTPVRIRYKFDYSAKTTSVLSIQAGAAAPFLIDQKLQNIPAQTTNWSMYVGGIPFPLLKLQFQLDDNDIPAGYDAEFQCDVYWSDQPIA